MQSQSAFQNYGNDKLYENCSSTISDFQGNIKKEMFDTIHPVIFKSDLNIPEPSRAVPSSTRSESTSFYENKFDLERDSPLLCNVRVKAERHTESILSIDNHSSPETSKSSSSNINRDSIPENYPSIPGKTTISSSDNNTQSMAESNVAQSEKLTLESHRHSVSGDGINIFETTEKSALVNNLRNSISESNAEIWGNGSTTDGKQILKRKSNRRTEMTTKDDSKAKKQNKSTPNCQIKRKNNVKQNDVPMIKKRRQKQGETRTVKTIRERKFECDVCGKRFYLGHILRDHKRTHTGERMFQCEVCQKTFTQKGSLYVHRRLHSGECPYKCDQCEKAFPQNSQLKSHKALIHSTEKKYHCDICDRKFKLPGALRSHITRFHEYRPKEIPSTCQLCGKSFDTKFKLKSHMVQHKHFYNCGTCGFAFSSRRYLKNHELCHIVCPDGRIRCKCGAGFNQKGALIWHNQLAHADKYPFSCNFCRRQIKCKTSVLRHARKHLMLFKLEKCHTQISFDMLITSKSDLLNYNKNLPRQQCSHCSSSFICPSALKWHKQSHFLKSRLECNRCLRRFSNEEELREHIAETESLDRESEDKVTTAMAQNEYSSLPLVLEYFHRLIDYRNELKINLLCHYCNNTFKNLQSTQPKNVKKARKLQNAPLIRALLQTPTVTAIQTQKEQNTSNEGNTRSVIQRIRTVKKLNIRTQIRMNIEPNFVLQNATESRFQNRIEQYFTCGTQRASTINTAVAIPQSVMQYVTNINLPTEIQTTQAMPIPHCHSSILQTKTFEGAPTCIPLPSQIQTTQAIMVPTCHNSIQQATGFQRAKTWINVSTPIQTTQATLVPPCHKPIQQDKTFEGAQTCINLPTQIQTSNDDILNFGKVAKVKQNAITKYKTDKPMIPPPPCPNDIQQAHVSETSQSLVNRSRQIQTSQPHIPTLSTVTSEAEVLQSPTKRYLRKKPTISSYFEELSNEEDLDESVSKWSMHDNSKSSCSLFEMGWLRQFDSLESEESTESFNDESMARKWKLKKCTIVIERLMTMDNSENITGGQMATAEVAKPSETAFIIKREPHSPIHDISRTGESQFEELGTSSNQAYDENSRIQSDTQNCGSYYIGNNFCCSSIKYDENNEDIKTRMFEMIVPSISEMEMRSGLMKSSDDNSLPIKLEIIHK